MLVPGDERHREFRDSGGCYGWHLQRELRLRPEHVVADERLHGELTAAKNKTAGRNASDRFALVRVDSIKPPPCG